MSELAKAKLKQLDLIVAIIAVIAIFTVLAHVIRDPDGALYAARLEHEIEAADRIVLIEQSHWEDFADVSDDPTWGTPPIEYGRVTLDKAVTRRFLGNVERMSRTTKAEFAKCGFRPHHVLEFYQDDQLISTMQICFECDDIKWDATELIQPAPLIAVLAATVEDAGFQPERDWQSLATMHMITEDSPTAE